MVILILWLSFSAIFSICAMSTIIITLNPAIILLVVLCAGINFAVAGKINYERYLLGKKTDIYDTRRDVLEYMMNYIGFAKEIRLFGMRDFLINKAEINQREMNNLKDQSYQKSFVSGTCNMVASVIQQAIIYFYLIIQVVFNGLAIGNLLYILMQLINYHLH